MRRCLMVTLLFVSATLLAQTDGRDTILKDALLDSLVGKWDAPGRVRGREVHSKVTAEWVLDHQFLQLKLEDTDYSAWIFIGYDFRSERYVIHWLDVFGGRTSETLGYGTRDGDSLRFVFEYPDGPFRNTLTWMPREKSWHWLIESKDQAGRWKTYAEYDLRQRPLPA